MAGGGYTGFGAGHGLNGAWELDQTEIRVPEKTRPVSHPGINTVIFHRDTCLHEVHFIIPPQPPHNTCVKQIYPLSARLGKFTDIHVRVCGDYRNARAWYRTVRACMWLSVMLQQFIRSSLCLSTHSAFDKEVGRGTPNECPGHQFYVALHRIKEAGVACPAFKR